MLSKISTMSYYPEICIISITKQNVGYNYNYKQKFTSNQIMIHRSELINDMLYVTHKQEHDQRAIGFYSPKKHTERSYYYQSHTSGNRVSPPRVARFYRFTQLICASGNPEDDASLLSLRRSPSLPLFYNPPPPDLRMLGIHTNIFCASCIFFSFFFLCMLIICLSLW